MRAPAPVPVVAVALLAVLAGGCIRAEDAPVFRATATGPVVFLGYDYAAITAQPSEGTFEVAADARADTGTATATFTFAGRTWRASFARFAEAPGRAFQEGGVRADFPEHGASGNGDALLPEFHALHAGWGSGTLTVDGQPFADPATGAAEFALHYMVTDTAPRDPATHQVTKADGAAPYDPATPADARTLPGTLQVLLNVQAPGGALPDTNATLEGAVQEAMHTNALAFDVNATGARVTVNVTLSGPTPAPPLAQLDFVLADPAGTEVGRFAYQFGPTANPAGSIVVPAAMATGAYTLSVSGAGVGTQYRAEVAVDHPEPLFLHVVYFDVRIGA